MEEVKVKVRIPTDWNDITLETYLKYRKTLDLYKDDDEDELDMIDKSIIISLDILCGVAPNFASQMPIEMLQHVMDSLNKFMSETKFDLQRIITIDGIEYGFEPNLSNMSYGAYCDMTRYDSIAIDKNWPKIMNILYRPVDKKGMGDTYSIEKYITNTNWDKWLDVSMDKHFGCFFLFVNISMDLLNATLNSLTTTTAVPHNLKPILERSGKAIQQSLNLQTETYNKSTK